MAPRALVAVVRPVRSAFHYALPSRLADCALPGVRCLVPFGRSRAVGFILSLEDVADSSSLKDVAEILDQEPVLPADLLRLGLWLAAYYHHPPGETLAALLPPACRVHARPVYRALGEPSPMALNDREERLWSAARRRGGLRSMAIRGNDLSALDSLLARGLLAREWEVKDPGRPLPEVWYALDEGAPGPDRVPARSFRVAEVLTALAAGATPRKELVASGFSMSTLERAVTRGWVRRWEVPARASEVSARAFRGSAAVEILNGEQTVAVQAVAAAVEASRYQAFLLQGVTGSGKTEVYIRAVEEARRRGKGAIVLVPEISLTPQFVGRFLARFGSDVAVLHSALGARERRLQWESVQTGRAPIAIGARSAIFAPVPRLGIVVVDEEHEASYKQEEGLRYNAKHVALQRARQSGAVALLGSATPDLESFSAALSGRYRRLTLSRRARASAEPEVRVVDLRQEERRSRSRVLLSGPLRERLSAALARGEQGLLFLNRRGFSPALVCAECGTAVRCPRCSVTLTLHGGRSPDTGRLICHYCSIQRSLPEICPDCRASRLLPVGAGTQKLMEAAREAWPEARILRLDRDSSRHAAGGGVLEAFHEGGADILVGTQMVAKGHDFPKLTVVGVVDADLSLHFPDFRAAERTYQVLTQVAGRAGRADLPGTVILQTRNPGHPVLEAVVRGDFGAFARSELEARRDAGFPPFRRLALLGISSPEEAGGRRFAQSIAEDARTLAKALRVEVLGPVPAPVERVRGRYRFQVLLKAPGAEPAPVQELLRRLLSRARVPRGQDVRFSADVDPVSLL